MPPSRPRGLRALTLAGALAFRACSVHADDVDSQPAPAPSGEIVDDEDGSAFLFDWSWDRGVKYSIEGIALDESLETRSLRWQPLVLGRVGFRLSVDAGGLVAGGAFVPLDQNVEVRRGYIHLGGEVVNRWKPLGFQLELGVVDNRFFVRNASLALHDLPYLGTFTAGIFDAPLSLSLLSSSRSRPLMESGLPVDAFAPGTKAGFQFANWVETWRTTWTLGFFGDTQDPDVGDASNAPARVIGRLTWLPERLSERDLVHLGLSASYMFSPSEQVRYRTRPESFLAPYLVDTGEIAARQTTTMGLEAAWVHERVSVQGEYLSSRVFGSPQGDLWFRGFYGLGSLFLTPDSRNYIESTAAFGSVEPAHPLSLHPLQLGAVELAGRYSYVDLTHGAVHGGRTHEVMAGLNWYWNRYFRIQLNLGYAAVAGGPRPGDYLVLQTRFDLNI